MPESKTSSADPPIGISSGFNSSQMNTTASAYKYFFFHRDGRIAGCSPGRTSGCNRGPRSLLRGPSIISALSGAITRDFLFQNAFQQGVFLAYFTRQVRCTPANHSSDYSRLDLLERFLGIRLGGRLYCSFSRCSEIIFPRARKFTGFSKNVALSFWSFSSTMFESYPEIMIFLTCRGADSMS